MACSHRRNRTGCPGANSVTIMSKNAAMDPLRSLNFHESFLMGVDYHEWPNNCCFRIWSPEDEVCYCIEAKTILEFHFLRTGTGPLVPIADGIPLDNVRVLNGQEYDYWSDAFWHMHSRVMTTGYHLCVWHLNRPYLQTDADKCSHAIVTQAF